MFQSSPARRVVQLGRLGILLAALGINFMPAAGLVSMAHAADAPAAAPAAETMRGEFAPLVKAYEEAMKAKDFKTALAKLAEMEAMPAKTPYESFSIERMRVAAASSAGDNAMTARALEATINSGRLKTDEQLLFMQALAGMKYNEKDYAKAVEWVDRYTKAGGNDSKNRFLLVQSLYNLKDYTRALSELRTDVKAELAAGKSPSEDSLKLMLNCMANLNDKPGYVETMQLLASHYPKKEYWDDLLNRYFGNTANADRFVLSFYRLKQFMGLMSDEAQLVEMAEMALRAAQPGEARQVLEKGFENGVLGKGAEAKKHGALRDRAVKAANDDLKTLETAEASAGKAKEGTGLVNLGYALVVNGKTDKGLELMERGLKLPLKKADEARILTGIAYAHAGRKDEAVKMFATAQSNDGATELAKYWSIAVQKPLAK